MLSIIIPTYNSAETLLESYYSVFNSGVRDQEIIFVDDGSTDATAQIIQSLLGDNPNISFLANDQNLGGGATRNKGVEFAKYPLVFILDSDDVLAPGSLGRAIEELNLTNADGVATSQSVFFSSDIKNPLKSIQYKSGFARFEDLVSHIPSPVTGNLLFTKQAFLDVGGYPSHHSFDTQGFGFRLLQNNKKILVGSSFMYYQRLPLKPSYYSREARAGNINRNWFYIFFESLYKFAPNVRRLILEFPCSNPSMLAKGHHLFNVLADKSKNEGFYCEEAEFLDERGAYHAYKNSNDYTLNAWSFGYELRHQNYESAFRRIRGMGMPTKSMRLLYPLISDLFGPKFLEEDIRDFSYFFAFQKDFTWRMKILKQKILNRLNIFRHF